MKNSLITIRKQSLQFQYNGNVDGFTLQKEVSDWCNYSLIPEIEQQLEIFNPGESHLSIDKLEIEATVDSTDWKLKIKDDLIFNLKQKLSNYKSVTTENREDSKGKNDKLDELILFYCKNGFLPWWGKAMLDDDFNSVFQNWVRREMSFARADFIRSELEQIFSKNVINRIINQLPPEFVFQFLKNIYKETLNFLSQLEVFWKEAIIKNLSPEKEKLITKVFYRQLLHIMILNKGKIDSDLILPFVYEELKAIHVSGKVLKPHSIESEELANQVKISWNKLLVSKSKKQKSMTKKNEEFLSKKQLIDTKWTADQRNINLKKDEQDQMTKELQEGIFIENAGAVIFAAYIPMLFERLELVKDGLIVNPDLATLIIQYCVSGSVEIAEHELVLPKILCGLEIDFPVNFNIKITEQQKNEADDMLQSLIGFWSILKDTSIDGLRASFLKRSGKLSFENNEWVLVVEQRPYDMLLERLPWSISMIKYPWMEFLLKTEWV